MTGIADLLGTDSYLGGSVGVADLGWTWGRPRNRRRRRHHGGGTGSWKRVLATAGLAKCVQVLCTAKLLEVLAIGLAGALEEEGEGGVWPGALAAHSVVGELATVDRAILQGCPKGV